MNKCVKCGGEHPTWWHDSDKVCINYCPVCGECHDFETPEINGKKYIILKCPLLEEYYRKMLKERKDAVGRQI